MTWHDFASAQNHVEAMVAPLTANVYIICHAALNAIACFCRTMHDFQQCLLGIDCLWCEQKGWDKGRWVGIYTPICEKSLAVGLAVKPSARSFLLL